MIIGNRQATLSCLLPLGYYPCMRRALYGGTFDPITRGHEDLILRASELVDELVVLVVDAPHHKKRPMLSARQRVELVHTAIAELGLQDRVQAATFSGLLVHELATHQASTLVRGLRAVTDFEHEQAMAHANAAIAEQEGVSCETVFMVCQPQYSFISSSLVREVLAAGGDAGAWLSHGVATHLKDFV